MSYHDIALVLAVVAGVLGVIELAVTRLTSIVGWSAVALAVSLALRLA